jgi:hypothetical protein
VESFAVRLEAWFSVVYAELYEVCNFTHALGTSLVATDVVASCFHR